jgi:hypothetical protein
MDKQTADAALSRARQADDQVWFDVEGSKIIDLRARDRAVAEALDAGVPAATVASELGVLADDVQRMVARLTA